MDGSFFAFALVGALVGYIVGDFQRERRYRREARANLAVSVSRSNDRAAARAAAVRNLGTVPSSNSDGDDYSAAVSRAASGLREARRRAVRGDNNWTRSGAAPAGRYLRSTDEAALVPAGGVDFDGD
jgi:hypothetical protein